MAAVIKDRLKGAPSRPTIPYDITADYLARRAGLIVSKCEEDGMNAHHVVTHCRSTIVAGSFALILPLSGLALDNAPPEALSVKVFPDRYVAAGKPFSDLAALEAWTKAIRIRTLWLDSCGPASTGQLLAAVERFHRVYMEGVQIRTFAAGEAACLAAAEQSSWDRGGMTRKPADEAYYATDQYGRSTMP
jgi:hypothetical protein